MWLKRILTVVLIVILLSASALWYSNSEVSKTAEGKTFDDIEQVPNVRVGLLLGTSKLLKNGRENLYFKYRTKAATDLFKNGKIQYLIISGDNGNSSYDEPTDMKKALIENGVDSTKLYLDYAGFRTFDSMVRVKEVFGQNKILVISQKFHSERAIYIAEKLHLYAIGFNAQDVQKYYGIKTSIREKFARVKVVLDFWLGVKPKFLGEKVKVG